MRILGDTIIRYYFSVQKERHIAGRVKTDLKKLETNDDVNTY
jgi:hypothetical protein